MPVNCGRKLTLSDAMIVGAATATALAVTRRADLWDYSWTWSEPYRDILCHIRWNCFGASFVIAAWSLAFLILRLRRPRPMLRRLARQPGMVACTVATVVLGIKLINYLSVAGVLAIDLSSATAWYYLSEEVSSDEFPFVPSEVGCAVAAAWTIQAIGGRWRPEPSWIDRLGGLLGAFWIMTIPFSWFVCWCRGG